MTNFRQRSIAVFATILFTIECLGCSKPKIEPLPEPDIRVALSAFGLPSEFFKADADTRCAGQIIGYRFVIWLNDEDVALGFNTSPNCRPARSQQVNGLARVLIFDRHGNLKAQRDVPYLADGNGELVAEGEARRGPNSTLLFRLQSVNLDPEGRHESESGLLLFDPKLKDVAKIDRFLEQTTFVDHALVFQDGFTLSGPRTYSLVSGIPPVEVKHWTKDWPAGTLDRKFGESQLAYILCQEELSPRIYTSSNIIHAGAKRRCAVTVEDQDRFKWALPLDEGLSAAIVGLLKDGSIVGQINLKGKPSGQLVIWKEDQTTQILP